jgi:hypothetical protein
LLWFEEKLVFRIEQALHLKLDAEPTELTVCKGLVVKITARVSVLLEALVIMGRLSACPNGVLKETVN